MTSLTSIPDESRRERTVAILLSLLIHVCIVLAVAWLALAPHAAPRAAAPPDEPVELTILPPPPTQPQFVQTNPADAQEKAPKDAQFESDNNTAAASQNAPTGSEAMPSVDGRESPAIELANNNYTPGRQPRPAAPSQPQPPQPQQQSQPPTEESQQKAATPVPTPLDTPQLSLREAPKPTPKEQQKAEDKTKQQPAVQPRPASEPGFQPETRVTRIRGNLSNHGRPSLSVAATPLGRYKKAISDAIGSRWYYYVNNQIGVLNIGTVDISFEVMPDGKVRNVRVLHNSSNESFASVSVGAIMEAEIPPIPDEVAKVLDKGRIEIDYSFTILSN